MPLILICYHVPMALFFHFSSVNEIVLIDPMCFTSGRICVLRQSCGVVDDCCNS